LAAIHSQCAADAGFAVFHQRPFGDFASHCHARRIAYGELPHPNHRLVDVVGRRIFRRYHRRKVRLRTRVSVQLTVVFFLGVLHFQHAAAQGTQ
jgi:hypothetical protein